MKKVHYSPVETACYSAATVLCYLDVCVVEACIEIHRRWTKWQAARRKRAYAARWERQSREWYGY